MGTGKIQGSSFVGMTGRWGRRRKISRFARNANGLGFLCALTNTRSLLRRDDGTLGTERRGRFLASLEMQVGLGFLWALVKYKVPRCARKSSCGTPTLLIYALNTEPLQCYTKISGEPLVLICFLLFDFSLASWCLVSWFFYPRYSLITSCTFSFFPSNFPSFFNITVTNNIKPIKSSSCNSCLILRRK